jgi:hypothetical protein
MFSTAALDRLAGSFADQFEADGAGYLYRRSMRGAPIPVTAAERDAFVAGYRRTMRRVGWSLVPSTIVLILALVALFPDADDGTAQAATFGGLGLFALILFPVCYRAWTVPAQSLERRAPVGMPLDRATVRRRALALLSYRQLGFLAAGAIAFGARAITRGVQDRSDICILLAAIALLLLAAVQALRKWHAARA